jgi:uncharacterized protein (DUF433 family)
VKGVSTITTGLTSHDYERLTRPLYSYAEADRLAGATRGTASRWLKGYVARDEWGDIRTRQPPVTPGNRLAEAVSFIDLIEVVAIGRLRNEGVSLPKIRQFVADCQEALTIPRPLVTESFRTDGRAIFIMQGEGLLLEVGGRSAQQVWDDLLDPYLRTIDYHHDIAQRWWPRDRGLRVVIDPNYGFGLPVVFGSGVRTELILERYNVGETNEEIAEDFGLRVPEVEDALEYELNEAA